MLGQPVYVSKLKSELVNASQLLNQNAEDTQSQAAKEALSYSQPIKWFPLFASTLSLYKSFPGFCQLSAPNHFWFGAALFELIFAQVNNIFNMPQFINNPYS